MAQSVNNSVDQAVLSGYVERVGPFDMVEMLGRIYF